MPYALDQRASGCRKVLQELVPIPNRSFRHTGRHAEQIPYHFYVGKRKRRDAHSVHFMHRDLCFAYPVGFEPTMGKNPRQVNSLMPSTAWLQIQFICRARRTRTAIRYLFRDVLRVEQTYIITSWVLARVTYNPSPSTPPVDVLPLHHCPILCT